MMGKKRCKQKDGKNINPLLKARQSIDIVGEEITKYEDTVWVKVDVVVDWRCRCGL